MDGWRMDGCFTTSPASNEPYRGHTWFNNEFYTTTLQLTLVHMYALKRLGPGRLLATFSMSFASIIASSNVWKCFSFKSISFSSGLVFAVDGVVVVAEDGMMVRWAGMSGTPGLGLKEFSPVEKFAVILTLSYFLLWEIYVIRFSSMKNIYSYMRSNNSLLKTQRKV